jgi:hypothetical protein
MSLTEKCLEVHTRQTDAGPTIETIGDAGSRRSESGLRDHLDGHADLSEGIRSSSYGYGLGDATLRCGVSGNVQELVERSHRRQP